MASPSLVRAGLLPALQGGQLTTAGSVWEVMVLRPGGDPITNLAKAFCEADLYDPEVPNAIDQLKATLGRSGYGLVEAVRQSEIESKANLLIVVDQFEEIFRFGQQGRREDEAAVAFAELLLEASQQTEQRNLRGHHHAIGLPGRLFTFPRFGRSCERR